MPSVDLGVSFNTDIILHTHPTLQFLLKICIYFGFLLNVLKTFSQRFVERKLNLKLQRIYYHCVPRSRSHLSFCYSHSN